MSEDFDEIRFKHGERSAQKKPPEFQEAPGETEADAVRDAFLKSAGPEPTHLGPALAIADGATRNHAVSRLQEERGNTFVQRVVAESRGTPGRLVGQSQPEMVDEVLQRKGSGGALPDGTRAKMEDHFGANLGGVRVHADSEAASLNRELNADAFTVGSDIFVAEGKYNPSSSEGQGLLAHEIAHVGQQTGFGGQAVQRQVEGEEEEKKPEQAQSLAPPKKEEEEAAG